MSNPPSPGSSDEAASNSNNQTDTKPKAGSDEEGAMEKTQEDAAKERATERGYQ